MTSIDNREWRTQILDQMDRCAQQYNFPMINNSSFLYARMRLTAFLASDEWLITFQILNYSPSHGRCFNDLYAYGNHIVRPGHQRAIPIFPDNDPWWSDERRFVLDIHRPTFAINGIPRTFSISDQDYRSRGIAIEQEDQKPIALLRYLAEIAPEELYIYNTELPRLCGRPNHLSKLIELDHWQHPDLAEDELPSSSKSLQEVAAALATGSATSLHYSSEQNTDWRHWT